ncbi:MAG: hypothetical protein M1822_007068 [Bathelium mastoideum]|nr:MAG: hypothetical protein M1822_007068 [Bathelium mastoideum]
MAINNDAGDHGEQYLHKRSNASVQGLERIDVVDEADQDRVELARAGKKQVLKRNFGLVSMTGFSCGLMCTWEGMLTAFVLGFENGGPAGLVYQLLVAWAGTLSVFIVMGELSSMVPTAGGQYHWVSILAPPSSKRFLSYVTGWLTVAGWVAALAATSFFVSSLILTLIVQNNPSYTPQNWQGTLLFWAILMVSVTTNTIFSSALPVIEVMVLILHILGFFATIIPLITLAKHGSAADVFTTFRNTGGWSTTALSFFVGLQGNANAFIGTDGAVHMSEEIKGASRNVPRAMILSTIINGVLAFAMLIAILFCAGNIDAASNESQYPFIPILANGLESNAGATVLTSLVIVLQMCASIGCLAASSRMIWSFARDRGVPGWSRLSQVNTRTTIPLLGIAVVTAIAALLGFVNLGSTTAFNDIISLTLEGLFTSYLVACCLLLYRRVRGEIGERSNVDDLDGSTAAAAQTKPYSWGPWHVPGIWGTLNNILAIAYLVIVCFFSFWPTQTPVKAADMNYSQTVWGAVVILSLLYYFIWAKKWYQGPLVEVELLQALD